MNQNEFLRFIKLKLPDLYAICKATSYEQVMMLKRELQQAITVYSKNKNGGFDKVQEKALAMMMKMEKWIRQAFMVRKMSWVNRNFPDLTDQGRKSLAKEAWEAYNKKMSY